MSFSDMRLTLRASANLEHAKILQRFFRTGPGQYGEGDIFIGLKVPVIRKIVNENSDLSLGEIQILLNSKIHEERLAALLVMVDQFKKSDGDREKLFKLYIRNFKNVNNWDLVDLSAEHIIGAYLNEKDKGLLYELARSKNLWQKRIAVLSTFHYIKNNSFKVTLDLAKILLKDENDLIHKAVGWMLREIGKRNSKIEEEFLNKHYKQMPRTMLRYAIERFPEKKRLAYLKEKI